MDKSRKEKVFEKGDVRSSSTFQQIDNQDFLSAVDRLEDKNTLSNLAILKLMIAYNIITLPDVLIFIKYISHTEADELHAYYRRYRKRM